MLDVTLSDVILKSSWGAAEHNVKDSEIAQHKVIVRVNFLCSRLHRHSQEDKILPQSHKAIYLN